MSEIRDEIKKKLTPKFLADLTEVARYIGWGADYVELKYFLEEVYGLAGVPIPEDLSPYPDEKKVS